MKSTWCFSTMITYTILCSGLCVMKSDCKHWTEDVSSVVEDCIVDWYFCFCQTFRLCERSLGPVTDSPTFYEVNIYLNCIRGRKQYVWDLHFKQKSKYLQSYNLSLMIFFLRQLKMVVLQLSIRSQIKAVTLALFSIAAMIRQHIFSFLFCMYLLEDLVYICFGKENFFF